MGGFTLNFDAANTISMIAVANGVSLTGGAFNTPQGADIASAATVNLDTATGNLIDVTGTTTITAITLSQGRERTVRFTGALILTNGASLVLPGAADITTAAGDFAIFRGYATSVVRCVLYSKAASLPLANPLLIANGGTSSTTASAALTALGGATDSLIVHLAGVETITGAKTFSGTVTMSGKSIIEANASIAAHATTMDPWSLGNYVTLTGAAVTFTAMTAAPQAGAEVELFMNAAHVFTDGAVFEVDGNANYTATIGDRVLLRAKSTTVFTVHPRKADGTAVAGSVLGTEQSATGTSINFTGIPPWVTEITVMFAGISLSGTDNMLIQIGDSGGIEASGYLGSGGDASNGVAPSIATSTIGFLISVGSAVALLHGSVHLTLEDSTNNTWVASGMLSRSNAASLHWTAGEKSLTGILDRLSIARTGADTFDAGSVNIRYS